METIQTASHIHDDWYKIEKAISTLSDKTLDDCVKRLNSSVFNKLYKSSKVDESKHDISMEIFDKILNEIDDDVKTQNVEEENANKNKQKGQYVGKEMRQFISKPVMLHLFCYVPFLTFFCFDCVRNVL